MLRQLSPIVVAATVLFACTAEEKPAPADTTPDTDATSQDNAAAEGTAAFTLAKADAMDGNVDKVVHKCAGCALGMDGMKEHSLTFEGYEMHFCAAGCLDGFSEDTEAKVLAMKVD